MLLVTYFEKLISNIQPSQERIEAVAEAHKALRTHLLEDADLKYPASDSFLSGSYARHTAVDPIKDVDVIVLLDHERLGGANPQPRAVLEDYKQAIDAFYEKVELQDQRRSIGIELPEDDIRIDVVPAVARNGKDKPLLVPDREQHEWIDSNPQGHIDKASDLNAATNFHFVRVTKLIKWWRSQALPKGMAPRSFLMEVLVAQHMVKAESLCEAFQQVVAGLVKTLAPHALLNTVPVVSDPALSKNDLAVSCGWTAEQVKALYGELSKLRGTADAANDSLTPKEKTILLWQQVFGHLYPSSLTEEDEQQIKKAISAPEPAHRHEKAFSVRMTARLSREKEGETAEWYPSNGKPILKNWWLRFKMEKTNVPPPYEIWWRVTNHGREARDASGLRGQAKLGTEIERESTLYRGHHYMDCEIRKNGIVLAFSRHIVNIK